MLKKCIVVSLLIYIIGCETASYIGIAGAKDTGDPRCPNFSKVKPGFYGGDGSTFEEGIIAIGLDYNPYRWIYENYPGSELLIQAYGEDYASGIKYDQMEFNTKSGEKITVYFKLLGGMSCLFKSKNV